MVPTTVFFDRELPSNSYTWNECGCGDQIIPSMNSCLFKRLSNSLRISTDFRVRLQMWLPSHRLPWLLSDSYGFLKIPVKPKKLRRWFGTFWIPSPLAPSSTISICQQDNRDVRLGNPQDVSKTPSDLRGGEPFTNKGAFLLLLQPLPLPLTLLLRLLSLPLLLLLLTSSWLTLLRCALACW
jgi:hypothetical protein